MAQADEVVSFIQEANDADSQNRQLAMVDLKFRFGDQWPQYAIASRGLDRPQLTINEIDSYIRQVTNMQRQQRPRIKVHPVDDYADKKIAKVISGLIRHIEVNSDADAAYDTAFDFAATIGWGYWRIRHDYISEDSFNQDIFIDTIDNPFSVYFDYNSRLPDGSDAERAAITDLMSKEAFKIQYPGAQASGFTERGTGDQDPDWASERDIRLAEYFCVERKRAKLVMLTDGATFWEDEMPPPEILAGAGVGIKGDRDSFKRVVKWHKQSQTEILETRDLPGRWIPVVPVYWTNVIIDTQRIKQGLVRPSIDPQRMINFWQTAVTEYLALAPKPKWLIAEGQDEGHEKEFANANLSATPVLRYKQTDVNGQPAPAPQRIAPEPPPSGFIQAAMMSNQNLQRVMGMFDPAARAEQEKSGKAILAEQNQSEMSNFHGYDNLTRSIKHTGRIILSYVPKVYDVERVQRIIGEDGKEELVKLNERNEQQPSEGQQAVMKVLNDVRVGTYDVVMETGPGYDTKRQEGVAGMLELMRTPIGEKVANVGDDLMVRWMDFPGSDVLADRLAAANPMSQIDEKSDVPPQAQMMIAGMKKQMEEMQKVIEQQGMALKYRMDVVQVQETEETKRALMKVTGDAHDTEMHNASVQHSTETKAITAQNVAEIKAAADLMGKGMDTARLDKEIAKKDAEQAAKTAQSPGTNVE
jgi:hypothetical protein